MKKKGKKHILRKILLTILLLVLLAGAGLYGWQALRTEYTIVYDSYTASKGSISNSLSFSGNLAAVNSEILTAPNNTTVRTLYVAAGEDVKEGQKLVRFANGAVLEAGFDGRVNSLSVKEGDEVFTGDRVIQIADFTHMKISFRVDEYDIADVSVGDPGIVTVTSNEEKYETVIDSIDYISASGGAVAYYTAAAYVDVTGASLPGMQATLSIPQQEATDVVVLKEDALSFDITDNAFVWMKDETEQLYQVPVETGVSNGNYVEIKSGLRDGDVVYAEAKQQTANALQGMLSGLFGQTRFNGGGRNAGVMGGRNGFDNMPAGGFDGNFGNMGGGNSSGRGGSGGSFGGGGSR